MVGLENALNRIWDTVKTEHIATKYDGLDESLVTGHKDSDHSISLSKELSS